MSSLAHQELLLQVSEAMFIAAHLFGFWLLVSWLRSGNT